MVEDVFGLIHRPDELLPKEQLCGDDQYEKNLRRKNMLLPLNDLTLPTDGGGLQRRNCK